jgi:hypothetical protein
MFRSVSSTIRVVNGYGLSSGDRDLMSSQADVLHSQLAEPAVDSRVGVAVRVQRGVTIEV